MQHSQRPRLNVESNFLIYFEGAPPKQCYPKLKEAANRVVRKLLKDQTAGELRFIETFEGWLNRKTTHLLFEFDCKESFTAFCALVRKGEADLEYSGYYIVLNPNDRGEFFRKILNDTSVDLIACNGIPPKKLDNHKYFASKRK
ncbi:hypothetical protein Ddc_19276 [Ditylenchus destructor]|nr:hypothetical protein Ddc_19276 [Ditylenchus destructor]